MRGKKIKDKSHKDKIVIYTADPYDRRPCELLKCIWRDTFDAQARGLAWRLFVRNISAQYRQTILGYLWVAFPPLVMSLVWIFLNSQKVVSVGETGIPYALYAFTGNILWQAFIFAMQCPINTVQKEKSILTKLNFSREAILLAGFGEALFGGLIQLGILIPIVIFFNISIGAAFLTAPFGLFLLILLGFTFGLLLTPIGLLYQDIGRAIPIIGRFWFFLTPIVYPMPTAFPANLINYLNPVTPMLSATRNLITGQPVVMGAPFFVILIGMVCFLVAGMMVYRLAMPHIIERMSA